MCLSGAGDLMLIAFLRLLSRIYAAPTVAWPSAELEAAHCCIALRPGLEATRLSAEAGAARARWLTNTLMGGYFANRTFFKLHHQLGLLDNPDQVGRTLPSAALTQSCLQMMYLRA